MVPTKNECREQNQTAGKRQKPGSICLELILVQYLTGEVFSLGNSDTRKGESPQPVLLSLKTDTEGLKSNTSRNKANMQEGI